MRPLAAAPLLRYACYAVYSGRTGAVVRQMEQSMHVALTHVDWGGKIKPMLQSPVFQRIDVSPLREIQHHGNVKRRTLKPLLHPPAPPRHNLAAAKIRDSMPKPVVIGRSAVPVQHCVGFAQGLQLPTIGCGRRDPRSACHCQNISTTHRTSLNCARL